MSESYIDSLFQEGTTDAARYGLLMLMTGISEEAWCAGWMAGLEYSLWNAKAGQIYGTLTMTERHVSLLKLLSDEAGGWWTWKDGIGATFVPEDEWKNIVANNLT